MKAKCAGALLGLALVVLGAAVGHAQTTSLLQSGDFPGFYLHQVYQTNSTIGGLKNQWDWVDWDKHFPGLTGTVRLAENWFTITKEDYNRYVRKHGRPPTSGNTIFLDRYGLPTPVQAAAFARVLTSGHTETTLSGVGRCWVLERQKPGRYRFDVILSLGTTAVHLESQGPDWNRSQAETVVQKVFSRLNQGSTPGTPPISSSRCSFKTRQATQKRAGRGEDHQQQLSSGLLYPGQASGPSCL